LMTQSGQFWFHLSLLGFSMLIFLDDKYLSS
jgi:hypothetical protein